MTMEKILLMGNPNVGKSALFSRMTGAKVIISNYPGTTVEFSQGQMKFGEKKAVVIDVPGIYALTPDCEAEKVAIQTLEEGSLIVNVVDATNLERNLNLTLQLLERNIPVIVALNIWDETKHKGIHIDVKKLEKHLGVPVVPTSGLTGEGVNELIRRFPETAGTLKTERSETMPDSARWERIGEIVTDVQMLVHHHHTLLERLQAFSIKPVSGLFLAACILYGAFYIIRFLGEGLIANMFEPLFEKWWQPVLMKMSAFLGENTFLHDIFIGRLNNGAIDFTQSFGLLSTGLFVPFAMVLPYIFSFYLVLGLLEDFGYLPRLAVLVDNLMHRLGLHGYALIPMMLGLGCKVPGILAIRILEDKRERFITAMIIAITIPCMAQSAMIIGIVGQRGGEYVALVFGTLFVLLIAKGLIFNKFLPGESSELIIEIPPYRIPQARIVFKKLLMRLINFLREAVPFVLLGVLLINILYVLKIIDFLAALSAPVLTGIWGLPKEAITALIAGFLRKDIAVGMLGLLNLTTKQLVTGTIILSVYFPCIATFVVLLKELRIKEMLKLTLIMIIDALVIGAVFNAVL